MFIILEIFEQDNEIAVQLFMSNMETKIFERKKDAEAAVRDLGLSNAQIVKINIQPS